MPTLSKAEKQQRRRAIDSVVGTHAMEGIELDATVHFLMNRYAMGELTLDEFSTGMDGLQRNFFTRNVSWPVRPERGRGLRERSSVTGWTALSA